MQNTHQKMPGRGGFAIFVPAVFLGAFLVFAVQPLIGKYILPWYGGTPAVWTTCLLVFQTLLFGGYVYAHLLGRLPAARQAWIHVGLLMLASLVSIAPAATWKPEGHENPLLHIVTMLLVSVGLPYFLLAATGPLLQHWFWRTHRGRSPYSLYAISNAGSLLALLSYPILVEPHFSGPRQAQVWRVGFGVFVALCAAAAWRLRSARPGVTDAPSSPSEPVVASPVRVRTAVLWVGWSACSVILFMAVTNQLTLNVASVPFLWVVPLSLYLLSFIVAFARERPYSFSTLGILLFVAVAVLWFALETDVAYTTGEGGRLPLPYQIGLYAAALFAACLACHGQLYRLRPAPDRLTFFYLCLSFGGMLGGMVVGIAAPAVMLLYQELHLGMLLACVLLLVTAATETGSPEEKRRPALLAVSLLAGILVLTGLLSRQTVRLLDGVLTSERNFFGVLRVQEVGQDNAGTHALRLFDGSILHGYQFVRPDLQTRPTVYYSERTGIGSVLEGMHRKAGRRIGVVGLGVGTLAAYGRPGDHLRFYEINPAVVEVATNTFSYLSNSAATWDVALGDARLQLEREPSQRFDVLVLDAFSSDAIPVHLLTREAFEVYERHLAASGAIAVHISNLHLDLSSVLYGIADARDLYALEIRNRARQDELTLGANWMVLSRDLSFLRELVAGLEERRESGDVVLANRAPDEAADAPVWTDHRNDLLRILR